MTPETKNWNWYEIVNSIVVWLSVGFISALVVFTSFDYSKSPPTFTLFGQNQLFLLGFITLLLLFRYIRKIKIGDIIDVELGEPLGRVNNLINRTRDLLQKRKGFSQTEAETEITEIRDELLTIKGNIEAIKAKAVRTS